ncbi:hypothetical protein DUF89 [Thermacetogenium phaeum DSM 12270]|uniref:Damage-control phosphatase ARMT1-like metal-binding domain-containing protein n=1 Tax=Thermacetogenium phaeum (strain ATCC BAA-254 / DSM 26808 / PB) TaxID=1089553 RepID=K4LU59_THEPS|nr:ARMT1-like domain-containing protein [Thermacetogenium phaeum]AFV11564.1 hypothetical protein DUF89 [Thermacetogenium phaeum DSM 12270]
MQTAVDCIPCYLKQVISTMRVAEVEEADQRRILTALFDTIAALDPAKTPAENSSVVLFEAYRLMGSDDPYSEAKAASNRLACTYLSSLEKIISYSEDPLLTAIKVSVAGNVIDMGINPDFDVNASIQQELEREFKLCDLDAFRELLNSQSPVVIIGDNSGEIVFDYLLLACLRDFNDKLFYVVKEGPILNDATRDDAEEAGIHLLAEVVTTGSNYLGVIPELCSEEFRDLMGRAGLVLAKGQANYETLEGTVFAGEKTFFLLRAKCPVVAGHLGVPLGSSVLLRNQPDGPAASEKK